MLTSLDQLQANFALVGDKSQYAGSMNQEYLSAVSTTQGATALPQMRSPTSTSPGRWRCCPRSSPCRRK
jgi:hypothetical protein